MNKEPKPKSRKAVKCPAKRTVNLAKRESRTQSTLTIVIGALLIALLAFAVAKFGVLDQLDRLSAAERVYDSVHEQYVQMQDAIANYPAVEQEYRTYSRKWMQNTTNGLFVSVDRMDVLDLLEARLMSCGTVNSFYVQNDTVIVTMSDMNLEEISIMFADLQRQPIVASAALTIASTTQDSANSDLDFSVTIILQSAEEPEA